MDIETAATSAIKNRIADTDLLSQYINERDKEPVWDGCIYAYRTENQTVENMIGKAPVQVKGKISKSLSKKAITYSVSVTNLTLYRNDGGVIYFVVYITADKQKKIYYASLTSFLLNRYIDMANGRKTISINLKELPEKDSDFENIVINFIRERHKQIQSQNGKNWTLDEVVELLGTNNVRMNCQFTCIGYDRNNPFEYLKDNELYLYAENEDGTLSFPVEHVERMESIFHEQEVEVSAKGKIYYRKIGVENKRDGSMVLHIGESIKFIFTKENAKFNYSLTGTLSEQIRTIHFLLDVIDEKCLLVNDVSLEVNPTPEELEKLNESMAKDKLKYLELIQEMLDKLGVKRDLDLDSLTDKQKEHIRMLINTILFNKHAGFKEKDVIPPVVNIELGNINVMLIFRLMEDGCYEVRDFFRNHIDCTVDHDGNYPTSQFCILSKDNFIKADNFDWEIVKNDFESYHNEENYNKANLCALELISAFDNNREKNQLLEYAMELCEWLHDVDKENVIYRINYLQCVKRLRTYNDEEIVEIEGYLQNSEISEMSRAALNILLDNKRMAEFILKRLSTEEKDLFETYPIYQLYKELK